jgi:exopolysaccharide biosynthesis protein
MKLRAGVLLALAACVPSHFAPPALSALPFRLDSTRVQVVADGVAHRYLYTAQGPWAIHVLYVDLNKCLSALAVKGADSAAGRTKTSALLQSVATHASVLGGVNADFFSLANGVPVNLLVVNGHMLTPPAKPPVLAFDSAGVPHIETFALRDGRLAPFHPLNAVGGRPRLVRDSVIVGEVDTEGQASFNVGRNPRTAAGLARGGRRLILVVVDGRQMPYSDGMSLREMAGLMLALGARDAINLDGGGSTTLVYADPDSAGRLRIANRPSDKEGERAVGDALAIVDRCA